ncbi:MAG TPA: response regulator [Bacteroidota bacterium]|nr:response regulator [Bacteroidota bacterium]
MELPNHTILVVEDEAITGIEIRRILEQHGYTVLPVVDDGTKAIEAVSAYHPDLVLMDIHLNGGIDGIVAAEMLAAHSTIPVVYLTSTTDDATFERAMATAPYGYIVKPFTDRDLFTTVETALHRSMLEQRLHESEARYRTLYHSTPAMLHSVSPDGTIINVNEFWLEKMEYSREEVIGKNIVDFMSEESRIAARARMLHPDREIISSNIEYQFVTKYGGRIDVLLSAKDDTSGVAGNSAAVMQDVTETKRVEKVLADERNLMAAIIETIPYSIYAKDTAHRFILANSRAVHALKANAPAEVLGATDEKFFSVKSALATHRAEDEILHTGRPVLSTDYFKRDPMTHEILSCIQVTKVPFYDASGVIAGIVGVNIDISEQKRTEETLRASEERYRRLFEDSKDSIFIAARSGLFIDVNRAGVEMLGYDSKEEVLALDLAADVLTDRAVLKTMGEVLASTRFIKEYEVVLKRKDGKPIIALVTASALCDANGAVIGFLGFVRDITSQRQIEMQLMHAQKMESVGTLAGGIAHDFNNVLSMILSAAELMKKSVMNDPWQKRYCDMIAEATARGTSIAKQLLVFARSEQMDLKPVSLPKIVDEILELMEHTLPKTIRISKHFDLIDDGIILGDSGHLHQALLNLAINAKDAMPSGGELSVSIGTADTAAVHQKFPLANECCYLTLAVHDTGFGMDAGTQSRIFEPFFSTKERGKGTGLGLAIVHGIVKSHNGFIDVKSSRGHGTTFTMYFPIAEKADTVSAPAPSLSQQGGNEVILIVDDEQFIRDTTADILRDSGYRVIEAKNGVEALQIYASRKAEIDLVITDLGMPGITGEELFVKLQQINPGVKAVVSTGYLEHLTKRDMLEMGVFDVIQKPFNIARMLAVVRSALDRTQPSLKGLSPDSQQIMR